MPDKTSRNCSESTMCAPLGRSARIARSERLICSSIDIVPPPGLRGLAAGYANSLPNDLDEHALRAAAVELAVENLLPRAKVEFAATKGKAWRNLHAACRGRRAAPEFPR